MFDCATRYKADDKYIKDIFPNLFEK